MFGEPASRTVVALCTSAACGRARQSARYAAVVAANPNVAATADGDGALGKTLRISVTLLLPVDSVRLGVDIICKLRAELSLLLPLPRVPWSFAIDAELALQVRPIAKLTESSSFFGTLRT